MIQKRRKKNWHKAKFHRRALSQLTQLMRSKPRIRADEVEIKVYSVHGHCMLSHYDTTYASALIPFRTFRRCCDDTTPRGRNRNWRIDWARCLVEKNKLLKQNGSNDERTRMSAIGPKRTLACALHMSASDPKHISDPVVSQLTGADQRSVYRAVDRVG